MVDTYDVFKQIYQIVGSIIGCTFLAMFVIFIHYFKLINKYKSKVLLLLARINVDEVDQEISKLNECLKVLDDQLESWITTSFYQIITTQFKKNDLTSFKNTSENKKKQKSVKFNTKSGNSKLQKQHGQHGKAIGQLKGFFNNIKNGFSHKQQENIKDEDEGQNQQVAVKNKVTSSNKMGSQKQISTLIQNHRLSIMRQVLIISFFCITGIIFFSVIITTNYLKTSEIEPLNNLFFTSIQNTQSLSNVITQGYLLVSNQITRLNEVSFPLLASSSMIQNFKNQLVLIQASINNIANSSTGDTVFNSQSEQESKKIIQIYEQDLCKLDDNLYSCQDGDSPFRQVIQKGLSGIITSYSQLFFNNVYLNQDTTSFTDKDIQDQFTIFVSNPSFKQLILLGFDMPMYFMMQVNYLIIESINNQISYVKNFIIIYFFSVGILILLLWLLFSIKTRRQFNNELRSINFSLTLLPYNKCQEEATIYILKSIQKL